MKQVLEGTCICDLRRVPKVGSLTGRMTISLFEANTVLFNPESSVPISCAGAAQCKVSAKQMPLHTANRQGSIQKLYQVTIHVRGTIAHSRLMHEGTRSAWGLLLQTVQNPTSAVNSANSWKPVAFAMYFSVSLSLGTFPTAWSRRLMPYVSAGDSTGV